MNVLIFGYALVTGLPHASRSEPAAPGHPPLPAVAGTAEGETVSDPVMGGVTVALLESREPLPQAVRRTQARESQASGRWFMGSPGPQRRTLRTPRAARQNRKTNDLSVTARPSIGAMTGTCRINRSFVALI